MWGLRGKQCGCGGARTKTVNGGRWGVDGGSWMEEWTCAGEDARRTAGLETGATKSGRCEFFDAGSGGRGGEFFLGCSAGDEVPEEPGGDGPEEEG